MQCMTGIMNYKRQMEAHRVYVNRCGVMLYVFITASRSKCKKIGLEQPGRGRFTPLHSRSLLFQSDQNNNWWQWGLSILLIAVENKAGALLEWTFTNECWSVSVAAVRRWGWVIKRSESRGGRLVTFHSLFKCCVKNMAPLVSSHFAC